MFESQNANSSNSPLRKGLTNMMASIRNAEPSVNLMPLGLQESGSGARAGNLLSVNEQMPASNASTQGAGAQGQKPSTAVNPPSYLPAIKTQDSQGKTLPQYRMGIGHRILGTLVNFANGFAGNHAQPIYVGPGALNNRYYQEEAQRQQQNFESA